MSHPGACLLILAFGAVLIVSVRVFFLFLKGNRQ
jgi:hypothetical protein